MRKFDGVDADKLRRSDRSWAPRSARRSIRCARHKFGFLGHSLVGIAGGALSGYFLQIMLMTMVTGSGSLMAPRAADVLLTQALAGALVGAIGMFAVGFAMQQSSSKSGD
jgi:hypothetical protein